MQMLSRVGMLVAVLPWGVAVAQEQAADAKAESAQEERQAESAGEIRQGPPPLVFSLRSGFEHTFESEVDDTDADVGVSRANADLGVDFSVTEGIRAGVSFDVERSWYHFEGLGPLGRSGQAVVPSGAMQFDLGASVRGRFNEKWSWAAGGRLSWAFEDDADPGDGLTGAVFGSAQYAVSETLSIGFGAVATSRLDDDPLVVPLLSLNWQVSDDVVVRSRGLGLEIAADLHETLTLRLGGEYQRREYRLADDNVVRDGILRDQRVPVGLRLDWAPTQMLTLSLEGGVVVWQEYRVLDSSGDELGDTNSDPAAFIGIAGQIRF